jgi:hypothetical protein
MKCAFLAATIFVFCLTNSIGQEKLLGSDPLTGLPLIPATDPGKNLGNAPNSLPNGQLCASKMQGNFYMLYNIKVEATVEWYSSHLSGFKKVRGYESKRAQIGFYKPDGTVVVFVTGTSGAEGEDTDAYSVAYERYQPGLSEKTLASLTQGKIICQ